MELKKLIHGLEIIKLHNCDKINATGIAYDSRSVLPGDVFVAVSGFETDGHKYINSAVSKGAVCVVCEHAPDVSVPYILVDNSRYALAILSSNFYLNPASEMKMIGVTGTNGKTTTTYLIKHLLESVKNEKVGLIGTNGNMIGDELFVTEHTTPESLDLQKLLRKMADMGCRYVVMEVSSHSLVLDRVAGINFDIGIFTNLTQDHLDFHSDMTDYAKAKAKLFKNCKHGIINIDDPWSEQMITEATCSIMTVSEKSYDADVIAKDIRLSPEGVRFAALAGNEIGMFSLGIPGLFSVYNALSVIACGLLLNINMEQVAMSLAEAKSVKGRVEVVPTDGNYVIIIDYAHTPDALLNVIKSLKLVTQGRVVVLFGCGGDRDKKKRPIMGEIAANNADFVIVTSDNPRTENPSEIIMQILEGMKNTSTPKKVIENRIEAIRWAIENHKAEDVIILAGKGHEDYQIIGKEKHHMDEREIVRDILEDRRLKR
ncbi:MAG: UDP-N-acetylmuramoyl-L-alanyl-D-glutamate--2,6-diaminopimelate ligase [Ruminococcaceae bacterium]|nr:UDP-N-acetylmuramoyl-L-alanyl-D-glutamate--2,6-diaminopimelate ligase [Oscillospiraceae bacterium]